VVVPWAKDQLDPTLFEYGREDTIEIEVKAFLRSTRTSEQGAHYNDPGHSQLWSAARYKIHAGYRRVLLGFNREIDFIVDDCMEDEQLRFRAHYLMKVIDAFVCELQGQRVKSPTEFRSRVLNPIVQRQRWGISDNDPEKVKIAVGSTVDDAKRFYLSRDPLDPQDSRTLLRHLLYITSVRTSLGFLHAGLTKELYERSVFNSKYLMEHRTILSGSGDQALLSPSEVKVIQSEGLQELYRELIEASVSSHHPFLKPQTLTWSSQQSTKTMTASQQEGNVQVGDGRIPPSITGENNSPLAEIVVEDPLAGGSLEHPQEQNGHTKPRVEDSQVNGEQTEGSTVKEQVAEASQADHMIVAALPVGDESFSGS
jgi:hypothetical protein